MGTDVCAREVLIHMCYVTRPFDYSHSSSEIWISRVPPGRTNVQDPEKQQAVVDRTRNCTNSKSLPATGSNKQ